VEKSETGERRRSQTAGQPQTKGWAGCCVAGVGLGLRPMEAEV